MLRTILLIFTLHFSNFIFCQSFYVCTDSSKIFLADVENCSFRFICSVKPMILYDIALTPDQTLYSTDGKKVCRIDPNNCTYTAVTDSIVNYTADITSLVAANDSILIGAATDSRLFKISINSGISTLMGFLMQNVNNHTTYYTPAGDLAFFKGRLYLSTLGNNGSGLLEIGTDANYSNISYLHKVGEMITGENAVYGLLTLGNKTCRGDNLKMIALERRYAYLVDPSDATVQKLCTWMNDNWMTSNFIYGAASIPETNKPEEVTQIELPNVFTPNGDSINDIFTPIKTEHVTENEVSIYDRWGNMVYFSNEKTFGWDGLNLQKEKSSEGNYFYICLTKSACDETIKHHGFITLLR